MKKNKWFGLALVATMMGASFSACSNDAEEVLAQESEIRLTSEITPSRVTSLDYQSTQIVSGQKVGVTITDAKSVHNNVAWTAGADGALANTGDKIYYGNGSATITAYHPYNSAWTGTSHTFSVSTDQSTNEGYLASDLLWATKTATKSEEAVALTFSHILAKINVTLVPEYLEMDLSDAIISICNTKSSTTFNPTTGAISSTTNDAEEIIAGVGSTASAIVVPQTITSGSPFIKVELEDKTFYYTLNADKELKSGYSHNYTLTVKEKALEMATFSEITDWTPDEGTTGDADETDVTPYLTFSANEEQTLTMSKAVETLEYSVNNGKWNDLGTTTVTFGGNNGDLRLRGKSSTGTATSDQDYAQISFGNWPEVACSGDIRTLVDFENYTTTDTNNAKFCYLFSECDVLTSAPELPATELAEYCYCGMFQYFNVVISSRRLVKVKSIGYLCA